MKNRVINLVLWMAYILAMLASLTHVAATLNTLELPGWHQAIGWIGAIAVDFGLAALAYAIQQRRRAKRSVRWFWLGIILFASISAYANVLHALSVNPLAVAQALVFSGALPALVIYMGEIVSSDDAATADAAEREQRRLERDAERKAIQASEEALRQEIVVRNKRLAEEQATQEAKALALANEKETQDLALSVVAQSLSVVPETLGVVVCEICEKEFANRFALSAHARAHKNGHIAVSAPVEAPHEP